MNLKTLANSYRILTYFTGLWRRQPGGLTRSKPRTDDRQGEQPAISGEGHEQNVNPQVRRPPQFRRRRSRRPRPRPGEAPVRSLPTRAPLHARTRPQVACQARSGLRPVRRVAGPRPRARQALILNPIDRQAVAAWRDGARVVGVSPSPPP